MASQSEFLDNQWWKQQLHTWSWMIWVNFCKFLMALTNQVFNFSARRAILLENILLIVLCAYPECNANMLNYSLFFFFSINISIVAGGIFSLNNFIKWYNILGNPNNLGSFSIAFNMALHIKFLEYFSLFESSWIQLNDQLY